ncbi:WDR59 [Cordylochernes scorpioides]|uniref:WDR59 n=1 Tax=Cordylochernes scorpioides TaxID=51811 RepID=A0ABY6LR85_9ARAC|nr:WDR59 [Cordylochernes scorpioides]
MALADSQHLVALSGRRCVALVDLHSPDCLRKKLLWQSKWEVGASEWSPHQSQCLALACNQRTEILTWKDGDLVPGHTLKAHTRAISDLNWSPFDPHLLATASIDASIHLWDLRDFRKPSTTLTAVAGASQVKWNKLTEHRLATTHDGDVRVWDTRKPSNAMYYLGAHLSMIHGLDWNPCLESHLCTSCQDGTVKFWDIAGDAKQPIKRLFTGSVVWKARYTPFRDGVVTAVVPQLRRGENSLVLWNSANQLVHTFVGPTDVVLDFAWATTENRDYDLVTWSKDQSLRMWHVDTNLQKLCRSEQEESPVQESPSLRSPNPLQQEFALVNLNIPNLTIDELDAAKRTCTVTAVCGKLQICVQMVFPPAYPNNAAPNFHFLRCFPTDIGIQQKLIKVRSRHKFHVLTEVSGMQVRRNRSCLEPCLRQLVTSLEQCLAEENHHVDQDKPSHEPTKPKPAVSPAYGTFRDANIPFPRTSGARFCGADLLVCFLRPPHLQKINAPTEVTPRQLSALNAYLSCHVLPPGAATSPSSPFYGAQSPAAGGGDVSITSFYQPQDGRPDPLSPKLVGKHKGSAPPLYCGSVLVYSVTRLLPIDFELAKKYDLQQAWNMAAHILDSSVQPTPSTDRDCRPWALYPICRPMIQSLINHYLKINDIQTVAMLCCIYGAQDLENQKSVRAVPELQGSGVSSLPLSCLLLLYV